LVPLLLFAGRSIDVDKRFRISAVSSCHPEMVWVQSICKAFLDHRHLDGQAQACRAEDKVENKRTLIRKRWMDTKQLNKKPGIIDTCSEP